MNKEPNSFSSSKITPPIKIDLDEFQISEDTFKPMTKGLGFHQDLKRPSFKPAPKEVKTFGSPAKSASAAPLGSLGSLNKAATTPSVNHLPSGLEAFYGTKPMEAKFEIEEPKIEIKAKNVKSASSTAQLMAWLIDVAVVASFVVLTGVLLIFASGIEFQMYSRLISNQDLIAFSAAIFSIYYLLYFTILDLSSSPGKTVMGLKLVKTDNKEVSVKHTFTRALISLLSGIALFLPMLLDFQGRLSDTKVVK